MEKNHINVWIKIKCKMYLYLLFNSMDTFFFQQEVENIKLQNITNYLIIMLTKFALLCIIWNKIIYYEYQIRPALHHMKWEAKKT